MVEPGGFRPVRWSSISQPFADPGAYASLADAHGPRGHHTGIDFGSLWSVGPIAGRPVHSCTPGTVVISEYNATMGHWVGVYYARENLTLTYWHMAGRRVSVGEFVQQGQILGKVGSTGNSTAPHLHVQANRGKGFDYHGHIAPGPWCRGTGWWRTAARKARKAAKRRRSARR